MALPKVILIVSADEDERAFFCEATGVINSSIIRLNVGSSEDAINYLQQPTALTPDFILFSSLKSPAESEACLTCLRELEKTRGTATAVFSKFLSLDEQQRLDALGADFYLMKPNTLVQMVSVLQYVFSRFQVKLSQRQRSHQLVA